ncbi:MAG TPA: hypothetical protein VEX13_04595 [Chloroflexia bacterium]|nr:hypothetical protein [Chloroflexia bacterium]
MQVRTEHRLLNIGDRQRPAISLAIAPRTSPAHLVTGIVLGAVLGFVAGSVVTLLIGEKSLVLAQHLWSRLAGVNDDGERVHIVLLLQ